MAPSLQQKLFVEFVGTALLCFDGRRHEGQRLLRHRHRLRRRRRRGDGRRRLGRRVQPGRQHALRRRRQVRDHRRLLGRPRARRRFRYWPLQGRVQGREQEEEQAQDALRLSG